MYLDQKKGEKSFSSQHAHKKTLFSKNWQITETVLFIATFVLMQLQ